MEEGERVWENVCALSKVEEIVLACFERDRDRQTVKLCVYALDRRLQQVDFNLAIIKVYFGGEVITNPTGFSPFCYPAFFPITFITILVVLKVFG